MQLQIDVLRIENGQATCNLYTGERCVKIFMSLNDCEALRKDGFFIRKHHTVDSAGVINTTKEYAEIEYEDGKMQLVK